LPRPTIRDVAREAGVGLGTVSRVLAGSPRVSDGTRGRVTAAIERLGYHPSQSARALSRGRSQTLEVILPLLTRYYYFEVLGGVLAATADTSYCLNLRVLELPDDRDRTFAEVDRRGHPDGLLVVRVRPTEALAARLDRAGVPAVLVDAAQPRGDRLMPSIGVDHRAAAGAMAAHIVSLGHRRIALVDRRADPFDRSVLAARRRGYRDALARAGIEHRPEYEPDAQWSAEGGAAALDALMALPKPPTAVLAGSDTQAIGVLDRARRRGLRVPGDLAVCGYGDIELARYLELTTVRVPMRAMGERAVALLLDGIEGRTGSAGPVRLTAELVVRTTCGAPATPA
jgi:DNA-binding LacI/PurR family transcriptional regulator